MISSGTSMGETLNKIYNSRRIKRNISSFHLSRLPVINLLKQSKLKGLQNNISVSFWNHITPKNSIYIKNKQTSLPMIQKGKSSLENHPKNLKLSKNLSDNLKSLKLVNANNFFTKELNFFKLSDINCNKHKKISYEISMKNIFRKNQKKLSNLRTMKSYISSKGLEENSKVEKYFKKPFINRIKKNKIYIVN